MNTKQFKRRWVNSKIEPELFYVPIKKEEEVRIYINKKAPKYYDFYEHKWVRDNNYFAVDGIIAIKNKKGKIVYITPDIQHYTMWQESIILPKGKYFIKYLVANDNASEDWESFEAKDYLYYDLYTDPLPPIVEMQTLNACRENIDVEMIGNPPPGSSVSLVAKTKVIQSLYFDNQPDDKIICNEKVLLPNTLSYHTGSVKEYWQSNGSYFHGRKVLEYETGWNSIGKSISNVNISLKYPVEVSRNTIVYKNHIPRMERTAYSGFELEINIPNYKFIKAWNDDPLEDLLLSGSAFNSIDGQNGMSRDHLECMVFGGRVFDSMFSPGNGLPPYPHMTTNLHYASAVDDLLPSAFYFTEINRNTNYTPKSPEVTNYTLDFYSHQGGKSISHIESSGNGLFQIMNDLNETYPYNYAPLDKLIEKVNNDLVESFAVTREETFAPGTDISDINRYSCSIYNKQEDNIYYKKMSFPYCTYSSLIFLYSPSNNTFGTNTPIYTYWCVHVEYTDIIYNAGESPLDTSSPLHYAHTEWIEYFYDQKIAQSRIDVLNGDYYNKVVEGGYRKYETHAEIKEEVSYSLPDIDQLRYFSRQKNNAEKIKNIFKNLSNSFNYQPIVQMGLKLKTCFEPNSTVFIEDEKTFYRYFRQPLYFISEEYDNIQKIIYK